MTGSHGSLDTLSLLPGFQSLGYATNREVLQVDQAQEGVGADLGDLGQFRTPITTSVTRATCEIAGTYQSSPIAGAQHGVKGIKCSYSKLHPSL